MKKRQNSLTKFYSNFSLGSSNECWIWKGTHDYRTPVFYTGDDRIPAARYMWKLIYYEVPNDILVMHKCKNTMCVNPTHLYINTDESVFWSHVTKDSPDVCWNWHGSISGTGYGKMQFHNKKFSSHRYSWILHFGKIPDGLWVLHKCDNHACCNPNHLFLGTPKDNMIDMYQKNRGRIGERSPKAKLKEEQVLQIISLYSTRDYTHRKLAKMYNVSVALVFAIIHRQVWKHLSSLADTT